MSKVEKDFPSWYTREVRAEKIHTDDPEALTKLQARLAHLAAKQEVMKATNTILRGKATQEDKEVALAALGYAPEIIAVMFAPNEAGVLGFSEAITAQGGAEIRRLRSRMAAMTQDAPNTAVAVAVVEPTEEELAEQSVLTMLADGLRVHAVKNGWWWVSGSLPLRLISDGQQFALQQLAYRGVIKNTWEAPVQMSLF